MAKRSYYEEIDQISNTWNTVYNSHNDLSCIDSEWLRGNCYAIGSGGSYSLAKLWEQVYEINGAGFAKAITPYEFQVRDKEPDLIAIFTASGKNSDILDVFRVAIEKNIKVLIFTITANSKLVRLAKNNSNTKIVYPAMAIPSDGFLAVNSTIAICCLILKLECYLWKSQLNDDSPVSRAIVDHQTELNAPINIPSKAVYILASGLSSPAAYDLESRFSESAFAPCILTDQRNFGHGRFMWFQNHSESTNMIVFDSPLTQSLTKRIFNNLPQSVNKINIVSPINNTWGAVYSLTRSILLFGNYAKISGQDPGRPTVPEWGRKIHRLKSNQGISLTRIATKRKINADMNRASILLDAIAFDFDGTLVNTKDRYEPINIDIVTKLERLLEDGILIGVATGRGKSSFNALKNGIDSKYHDRILVGMYNGTIIRHLSVDLEPGTEKWHTSQLIWDFLKEDVDLPEYVEISLKATQISIRNIKEKHSNILINKIIDHIGQHAEHIKFLTSGHSLDILPRWASKINLVQNMCKNFNTEILCVGDQGQVGGNDEEFLKWLPSVSVGSKQPQNEKCFWIGRNRNYREINGTIVLLDNIVKEGNRFKLNIEPLML